MQMLGWQRFCRRLATTRIVSLDIRDIGMGPKAMGILTGKQTCDQLDSPAKLLTDNCCECVRTHVCRNHLEEVPLHADH
jgi:hypothetical protein